MKEGETWKEAKLIYNTASVSNDEKSMNVEEVKIDESQKATKKRNGLVHLHILFVEISTSCVLLILKHNVMMERI